MTPKVYVASAGAQRHKVGRSANPTKRMYALHGVYGHVTLAGVFDVENAHAVERMAHWLLRDFQIRGEWFRVPLAQAVEAVQEADRLVSSGAPSAKRIDGLGRRKVYDVRIVLPLSAEMAAEIDAALMPNEPRVDFIRGAMERFIRRREQERLRP